MTSSDEAKMKEGNIAVTPEVPSKGTLDPAVPMGNSYKNNQNGVPRKETRTVKTSWIIGIVLTVVGVAIALVILGLTKWKTSSNNNNNNKQDTYMDAASRREYIIQTLGPSILGVDDAANQGSALLQDWDQYLLSQPNASQSLAIEWLSQEDDFIWSSSGTMDLSKSELLERYAMVVYTYSVTEGNKEGFDGEERIALSKLSETSVCDWDTSAVKCEDDTSFYPGLISFMNFSYAEYYGEIPTELAFLKRLAYLDLVGSGFVGTLPTELARLTQLTYLMLASNELVGTLPTELARLTKLTYLMLASNELTGTLEEMRLPKSLEELYFNDNAFSGSLPSSWGAGALSNLKTIVLAGNDLEGSLPSEWGNFSHLTVLDLSRNGMTGSIPTTLGRLTALRKLSLKYNSFKGGLPSEFGNLVELEFLYARSMTKEDFFVSGGTLPSELGNLQHLKRIDLGENRISGSIPSTIGLMTSLIMLYADQNLLSGPIPSELGALTELYFLSLGNNQLTGSLPSELGNLSDLRTFSVSDNFQLGGTVPAEYGNWSNYISIDLSSTLLTGSLDSIFCEGDKPPSSSMVVSVTCLSDTSPWAVECSCCYCY